MLERITLFWFSFLAKLQKFLLRVSEEFRANEEETVSGHKVEIKRMQKLPFTFVWLHPVLLLNAHMLILITHFKTKKIINAMPIAI